MEAGAKRQYVKLTPAQRFQISKKGVEIGIAQAVWLYNAKYPDLKVSEPKSQASVHWQIEEKSHDFDDLDDFNELPARKRGRPLLLG